MTYSLAIPVSVTLKCISYFLELRTVLATPLYIYLSYIFHAVFIIPGIFRSLLIQTHSGIFRQNQAYSSIQAYSEHCKFCIFKTLV